MDKNISADLSLALVNNNASNFYGAPYCPLISRSCLVAGCTKYKLLFKGNAVLGRKDYGQCTGVITISAKVAQL